MPLSFARQPYHYFNVKKRHHQHFNVHGDFILFVACLMITMILFISYTDVCAAVVRNIVFSYSASLGANDKSRVIWSASLRQQTFVTINSGSVTLQPRDPAAQ